MSFPSSPTQALRPSSGPSPEKAPNIRARHSKSALRSADDCISQMKTPDPERARTSKGPHSRDQTPAPWLRLSDAPLLSQAAFPLPHPALDVGTMCSFSLQLPNPSAFSAQENPFAHQGQKWGGRTGAGLLQAFHPAIADGLKPDLQPKKKKRCSF